MPRTLTPMRRRSVTAAVSVLALFTGFLQAATPAQAADPAPTVDRSAVITAWNVGGAQVKAAAATALTGTDDQVRDFLTTGWNQAQQLDERDSLVDVMSAAGPSVRSATQAALDKADAGDTSAIGDFLATGWQRQSDVDDRVSVDQLMAAGGSQVKNAAQQALDAGDTQTLQTFIDSGWQSAWQTDQRLQVNQAMADGGPEVKAAAQRALDEGTPEALQEFLSYGLDVASARDDEVATLTGLMDEAQASADTATQDTQHAVDEAGKASAASQAAEKAAAEAAAATAAAKSNAGEAARQAQRAATAARKAATAAEVAIDSADAAESAAHAAARAASRAASAAATASQKANDAYKAAIAAAGDKTKADAAKTAAVNANNWAQVAENYATLIEKAGDALVAGKNAIVDAKAAAKNAKAAADDNDAAIKAAKAAGVDAGNAVADSQAARADADRADRAAASAEIYYDEAITAAYASRDAARRAAADARAAAAAATEAANDAGDAAQAATRATKYATAASAAAQAAIDAAGQATLVYTQARQAEADRIAVDEEQGAADAADAEQTYERQLNQAHWDTAQAALRDTATNRLIAEAQSPDTATDLAVTDARQAALALMSSAQGTNTRMAAQDALGGTDEDVLAFIRTGLPATTAQDDRQTVENLAITDNAKLKAAAETALQGTDADVATFIQTQAYPNRIVDDRIKVNQVQSGAKSAGNTLLANAAQAALDAGTDQAYRDFLDTGQYTAGQTGQRVLVNNILAAAGSGPELKAAAQVALAGPPSAIADFLDTGQYTAAERDADTASHLEIVDGILDQTNEAAQTALQRAQEAQSAAWKANGDATKAADYATQATKSAQNAAGYATAAQNSAAAASASVQKAGTAVQTARAAATRADSAADSALRSAAWAITSQQQAQASAQKAHDAAVAARQSALDAKKDAQDAAAAGQAAYKSYLNEQGAQIEQCATDYANKQADALKAILEPDANDSWYANCVKNAMGDVGELANRSYTNSSLCEVYPGGSKQFNDCVHSTLDPAFRGTMQLDYIHQALLAGMSFFLPAVALAGVGCLVTVCGAVLGSLLTFGDVGDNLLKLINGDQSLAQTALSLGKTAIEALAFDGIGKLLGKAFVELKALRVATQDARAAKNELTSIEDARQFVNGLASCSVSGAPKALVAARARVSAAAAADDHMFECPTSIALGLTDIPSDRSLLENFAELVGAPDFREWPTTTSELNPGDWEWNEIVTTLLEPGNEGTIHFNLTGIKGYPTKNGKIINTPSEFADLGIGAGLPVTDITAWELNEIRNAPDLVRARVKFYLNGKEYTKDPFTQWNVNDPETWGKS